MPTPVGRPAVTTLPLDEPGNRAPALLRFASVNDDSEPATSSQSGSYWSSIRPLPAPAPLGMLLVRRRPSALPLADSAMTAAIMSRLELPLPLRELVAMDDDAPGRPLFMPSITGPAPLPLTIDSGESVICSRGTHSRWEPKNPVKSRETEWQRVSPCT